MYYIKRAGVTVNVLNIRETANWGREYDVVPMTFKTLKGAEEVASVWEDAEIASYEETQMAA